jgi:hypothetical protein
MDRIYGGSFQVARQLFSSEIWREKPSSWKVIWIYILGKVNHKKNGKFDRGEGFFNFSEERRQIGNDITSNMIKRFCQYALRSSMTSTKRSTRGMLIKVINYDKYQTLSNFTSTNQSTSKAREKHEPSTPINKNDKNDKNDKNERASPTPADKAIEFFKTTIFQEEVIKSLVDKAVPEDIVRREITKFISYWTELNKLGTKQRWEMEKTFEVSRRLTTWFSKIKEFSKWSGNNKKLTIIQ